MPFTAADVAPIIADVLATVRFLAPLREVLIVRKERQLGQLNPLPFAAAVLNTTGWVVYAVLKGNLYIFFGDAFGLLVSLWMLFSLFPYATSQTQDRLNLFVVGAAALWTCLTFITIIFQSVGREAAIIPLWGWAVSVTQVVLMGSPLSTIYKAIKERSSASFHMTVCVMGLVTSTLWVVYAVVIHDLFVMVPNMLGGLLSLASVAVCLSLSRAPPRTPAELQQTRMRAVEQAVELG